MRPVVLAAAGALVALCACDDSVSPISLDAAAGADRATPQGDTGAPGDAGIHRDAARDDGADGDASRDAGGGDLGHADAGPRDTGTHDAGLGDTGAPDTGSEDSGGQAGPCPALMALVNDAFCIDLYEGALEEQDAKGDWVPASPYLTVGARTVRAVPAAGITPQGYIAGDEAQAACGLSGKRLCTSEEWLAACRGPDDYIYPYGDTHIDGACNDHYPGTHPVVDYFGTDQGVWDMQHMNDPGINQQPNTVAEGGQFAQCMSHWGAFDMHGNLHEWVADADGTFRGGFYADAKINGPGCTYKTVAHEFTYHDYSTGFRCCADRK